MARTLKDKLLLDKLYLHGYITQPQRLSIDSLKALIDSGLVSADIIIETLSATLHIPILDISFQKVIILEFNKVSEYSLHGYFICTDSLGNKCVVITNPLLLTDTEIIARYKEY